MGELVFLNQEAEIWDRMFTGKVRPQRTVTDFKLFVVPAPFEEAVTSKGAEQMSLLPPPDRQEVILATALDPDFLAAEEVFLGYDITAITHERWEELQANGGRNKLHTEVMGHHDMNTEELEAAIAMAHEEIRQRQQMEADFNWH